MYGFVPYQKTKSYKAVINIMKSLYVACLLLLKDTVRSPPHALPTFQREHTHTSGNPNLTLCLCQQRLPLSGTYRAIQAPPGSLQNLV